LAEGESVARATYTLVRANSLLRAGRPLGRTVAVTASVPYMVLLWPFVALLRRNLRVLPGQRASAVLLIEAPSGPAAQPSDLGACLLRLAAVAVALMTIGTLLPDPLVWPLVLIGVCLVSLEALHPSTPTGGRTRLRQARAFNEDAGVLSWVSAEPRGTGSGAALLDAVLDSEGATYDLLLLARTRRLATWYASFGFVEISTRTDSEACVMLRRAAAGPARPPPAGGMTPSEHAGSGVCPATESCGGPGPCR